MSEGPEELVETDVEVEGADVEEKEDERGANMIMSVYNCVLRVSGRSGVQGRRGENGDARRRGERGM